MNKINNLVKNNFGDFMYKKYTFFAVLICFSICSVLLDHYTENILKTKNDNTSYYVLKSENDVLTLYKGKKFVRCYDFNTTDLPLTDQDNLKSGIILENMDDVMATIEDFDVN